MAPEAGSATSIGVLLAVSGDVYLRSEAGVRQVQSGAEVYQGDELVTGPDSSAEVRFADDTLLSQGADSTISLDDYVFDSQNESASTLLFKMSQGTFRMVTGKIAEQNPDRFQIGSPLATIGIRGTTTVHEIGPNGEEKHGVEEIHSGKALLVQSIDGSIRVIDSPQALVDIAASGQISTVRPMTVQELNSFRDIAPQAIQQEQEIREQDQQDEQDNEQEQQNSEEQNEGEQAQGADGESQQEAAAEGGEAQPGEQAEGGEPGNMQIGGEGVIASGVAEMLSGNVIEGEEGLQELISEATQEFAEDIFDALAEGDLESAQELLDRIEELPTDEDEILELIEDIAEGNTEVPEGLENVTYTSSEGTNYILGANTGEEWEGTENVDYYDGQGGNDTIYGMEGNDGLRGGEGDDTIYGNCGDDQIEGGTGDDTIYGGKDSDMIDGGSGTDIAVFSDLTPSNPSNGIFVDLNLSYRDGSYGIASLDGTADYLKNVEGVVGTSGNDSITGDGNANVLIGNCGNDVIKGEGGTDTLSGGSGVDTLTGGGGADTLTGGAGYDFFYYAAKTDFGDKVTDFECGNGTTGDNFKFASSEFGGAGFQTKSEYDNDGGSSKVFVWDTSTDILYYDADGKDNSSSSLEAVAQVTSDSEITSDHIEFI